MMETPFQLMDLPDEPVSNFRGAVWNFPLSFNRTFRKQTVETAGESEAGTGELANGRQNFNLLNKNQSVLVLQLYREVLPARIERYQHTYNVRLHCTTRVSQK